METKVQPTSNVNATAKVRVLMGNHNADEVAEMIGISRRTLFLRLQTKEWKKAERVLISQINV